MFAILKIKIMKRKKSDDAPVTHTDWRIYEEGNLLGTNSKGYAIARMYPGKFEGEVAATVTAEFEYEGGFKTILRAYNAMFVHNQVEEIKLATLKY